MVSQRKQDYSIKQANQNLVIFKLLILDMIDATYIFGDLVIEYSTGSLLLASLIKATLSLIHLTQESLHLVLLPQ